MLLLFHLLAENECAFSISLSTVSVQTNAKIEAVVFLLGLIPFLGRSGHTQHKDKSKDITVLLRCNAVTVK